AAAAGIAAIAAVPLVATGITATQLGLGVAVEAVASVLMAAGGALAAALHLRLAADAAAPAAARLLWAAGGVSLVLGMALAALYGLRFVHPWRLDLGWMQVSHGPLNAIGFGLATLLGWRAALR
ncbi:MAG TPA: hypothetical protein VHM02_07155, partial [Thermoanaerobaculia bacterium]|nr:hypothetical protein [Thermoanaerobaculia bacterium]